MKYWQPLAVVAIAGGILWLGKEAQLCCSARRKPSALETAIAHGLRNFSIPSALRGEANPLGNSPQLLEEGAHHFADHCALCHANDGSGHTVMGSNLSPPVPDMRRRATQELSDGELYWIIHNGVRFTGMPAWGDSGDETDTWKLVLFIRHLPQLTAGEVHEMERLNPISRADLEEEKIEQDFLNGGPAPQGRSQPHSKGATQ